MLHRNFPYFALVLLIFPYPLYIYISKIDPPIRSIHASLKTTKWREMKRIGGSNSFKRTSNRATFAQDICIRYVSVG